MLDRLIDFCLDNRWLIVGATVLATAFGVYQAMQLPIEAFPDLTNNQVTVITECGPMSPTDVEQLVTFPIESGLMGLPGKKELRSISKLGLSLITIVFDDAVVTRVARQLVNERLREVQGRLPPGLEPVLGPTATAFGELYQYTIENSSIPLMERKTLHDWVIRPQLRSVAGINEVNTWGGYSKQITVEADPVALNRYGLSLRDVFEHVQQSNSNFGGGFIEHASEQYNLLGMGRAKSRADIESVVLKSQGGVPVLVRDVATVEEQPVPRQGAVVRDATDETVCGMAIMLKGENGREVIRRVKERLAAVKLPPGTRIVPFYDQSDVIDATIATVRKNLLEAGLLVAAVLLLFLGNVRAALVVTMVIPLGMIFGFMGMAMFGVSANLMSLGAIDFGMIVDGAVVMMENSIRRLATDPGRTRVETIRAAAKEVARPILFAVAIIIAVYLPVLMLEELEGRMFRPMAIAVCSALLGSLLLALMSVPVFGSLLLPARVKHSEGGWFSKVLNGYERTLGWVLSYKRLVIAVAALILIASIGSVRFLGTEFMPKLDEGSILVQAKALPGISVPASVQANKEVQKILLSFPEVGEVVSKLGRPDVATEAMGVYEADIYVILKKEHGWLAPDHKQRLIDDMAKRLEQIPGMVFNFTMPMAMRMDETISGVKADVAVKIFGDDSAVLGKVADRVQKSLEKVEGVADLQVEIADGVGELRVEPNRAAMARYGLTITDLQEYVDAAAAGRPVSEFIEGQRRFPLVVRLAQRYRDNPELLKSLILTTPSGEQIRLEQVVNFATTRGPEVVNREDGQRRLVVQCNVRNRDLGSFVAAAQAAVKRDVSLPTGYWIDWGGQFENQERASHRLMILLPMSIAIILGLLYATFHSMRQAFLILLAVPFASIGGVAMLWIRGLNLNVSASIGFIALFGVAVLNGIVMVTMINQLRDTGIPIMEAVRRGAALRLRPVLMTALVAALGFLPMMVSVTPGSEVQRPLASVVVGGLFTATLLTLYLLPVFYLYLSPKQPGAILEVDGKPLDPAGGSPEYAGVHDRQ